MSVTFRNLLFLALICGLVSSLSISSNSYAKYSSHMQRVPQSHYMTQHSQQNNDAAFFQNLQTSITTISNSVQPTPPSIIETKNLPIFTFSKSTCDILNADQKKKLLDQAKASKDKINSFKTNVKDNKVLVNADNAFKYLTTAEQLLNKKCADITTTFLIGPSPFQTNINTNQPWIYGGITMNDIKKDYTDRINKNDNVTNCGAITPFWNGFKCISCEPTKPVWNMATSECVTCPADKPIVKNNQCTPCPADKPNYNPTTKQCEGGCPADKPFMNPTSKKCEPCPADKPLFQNNACVACPAATPNFNPTSKKCEGCPADKPFLNPTSKKCEPCPADKPLFQNNACVACPADKPIFNAGKKQCQACPADKPLYNPTAKKCEACPAKFQYDPKSKTCVASKPNSTNVPLNTPRLVMNKDSTKADWDKYVKENENKIICPQDKPFWTGTQCIQCPQLFNIITKKCMVCDAGFAIHVDSHKCEPVQPLEPSLKDLFNAIL